MSQLPQVVDREGYLLANAEDVLASIAYGQTTEQSARFLRWSGSKAWRWRTGIEAHYGVKSLKLLLQLVYEDRNKPEAKRRLQLRIPSRGFRGAPVAATFNRAVAGLRKKKLTNAEIQNLIDEYAFYPRANETTWHLGEIPQKILAKAGVTSPQTGTYALIMTAAAQLGIIDPSQLQETAPPEVVEFRHEGVAIRIEGRAGERVTVIINGVRTTRIIPGAPPKTNPAP